MNLTITQALKRGMKAHKEGKLQEAEKLYIAILSRQPKHPDANHNLGILAVSVGRVEGALPYLKTALEENPKVEQFWLSYTEALMKLGKFDNARQVLDQVEGSGLKGDKIEQLKARLSSTAATVSSDGNDTHPSQEQLNSLSTLYSSGRIQEALTQGTALARQFPNDPSIPNILGAVYSALGQQDNAIASYNKSIELKPDFAAAYSNLGNVLTDLGKHKDAIICYNKSIELNPRYAQAHNNLGKILNQIGRHKEAIASCNKAIKENPDLAEAYINLGSALNELGKREEAIEKYNRAVALRPEYAEAYNNIGNVLYDLHKYYEAIINYNKAIKLNPNYVEVYGNLGNTFRRIGKYEDAIASYQKATRWAKDFPGLYTSIGDVFKKIGKYKQSVYYYDLENSPYAPGGKSLEVLYMDKNYEEFYKRLNVLSHTNGTDIRIAAISAFVSHQLKYKDPYPFCRSPLDFFYLANLKSHTDNVKSFVEAVITEAEKESQIWEPRNKTTKNGFQTPSSISIFQIGENCSLLETYLRKEITAYFSKFSSEDCSLIRFWPDDFSLHGWYVRLIKNGHQKTHIHATGWLSGVVYLKAVNHQNSDEGAIELGLHGFDLPILDNNYPKKVHRPQEGDVILFPSSLFHRTIPFSENTNRCVIAFDLMPLGR